MLNRQNSLRADEALAAEAYQKEPTSSAVPSVPSQYLAGHWCVRGQESEATRATGASGLQDDVDGGQ